MAGVTLEGMGVGPALYHASKIVNAWPTAANLAGWDLRHSRILSRWAATRPSAQRQRALELAELLNLSGLDSQSPVPTTMASARYRYAASEDIGSHVSLLCSQLVEPAYFFTVVPSYGEVSSLQSLNAVRMKERFRNDLNDCGALRAQGVMFAVIEAEYQVRTNQWRFHFHGVASEGKLGALNELRRLPAYRTRRRLASESKAPVPYRIKACSQPVYELPNPLTYCIKQWNARWQDANGKRGRRLRMPRAVIPEMLLWQHEWSLRDLALFMGLRPTRGGLSVINGTRIIQR